MSQTQPVRTIAFFGATGGCINHTLVLSLKAGYTCIALARTPSKLTSSLKEKGITTETLDRLLTIIPGDGRNLTAVKQTLQSPHGQEGEIVDLIVSGVGGTPHLQWSLWKPVVLGDKTICQDVGATILSAAKEFASAGGKKRPLFINISTTGIPSPGSPWDVPFWFTWFYSWVLQDPHDDKEKLEEKLRAEVGKADEETGIGGFVTVKPSLLMDGEGKGLASVRWGVDEKPAIGYTIQRGDVGRFIFERIVREDWVGKEGWRNKSVSITY